MKKRSESLDQDCIDLKLQLNLPILNAFSLASFDQKLVKKDDNTRKKFVSCCTVFRSAEVFKNFLSILLTKL